MKMKSVVLVVLLAIIAGNVSVFAQAANPMGGPDDQPYFSDATGAPKACFVLNEPVYVAYFDTTNNYNNSVNAADTMYVSVASQGTENFAALSAWAPDVVSGTINDGPDIGLIPGDHVLDIHVNPGNAQVLALQEQGLDNGLFIADVGASTPIVIIGGDLVTVGLTANDQDVAYVQAQLLGWWDSVTTPDPGNAGSYGAGDDLVVKVTAESANTWANASGSLYYRVNGGAWQNGGVWSDVTAALGGVYPDRYLEITAPGTSIGDTVDVLWQPGIAPPGGCFTTPALATAIVDQPVDLANATYLGPGAPNNGSTGFVRDYMTINEANAQVGGVNWWIGVHAAPAVPAYDYTHDTFPINIDAARAGLTIIGDGTARPIVTIDNGAGVGFDIQAAANNVTLDYLDIRSDAPGAFATTFLVQLVNGPQNSTIQNCYFNVAGGNPAGNQGISVGAAGSTNLTIDNNTWTAMDAADGAIWLNGPNPNVTVTNNTFFGAGGGYAIEGMGWSNGTIDNNTINNFNFGIFLGAEITGTSATTNGCTITRNTITGCGDGIRFYTGAAAGSVTNVTVEGNLLTGNIDAIHVGDGQNVIDTANIVVKYNNISGNTDGINDSDADATLNAELNWWGSTTGPTHAAANADGAGDTSTANVDYRPWLNGIPFCGTGVTLNDNIDPAIQGGKTVQGSSWYWTINQALAATNALPGCTLPPCWSTTIDVGPGTYAERIIFGYGSIGETFLRSTGGKAVTNIEAGVDNVIISVNGHQTQKLTIGNANAADKGFTIYFDTAAVTTPTVNKIELWANVLNIYDSTIDATTGSGIVVNSNGAIGTIKNNLINGCGTSGIWLHMVGTGMTIDGNTITNGGDGIVIDSGTNTVINNTIQFNTQDGIVVGSNGNAIGGSGNSILNNAGTGVVVNGNSNTVAGNTIHNNGDHGILVTGDNNVFNTNMITSNAAQGVRLTAAASGNVFNVGNTVANTNCIFDNDSDGSNNYEQMQNQNTGENVDATYNYWGSAAGPFNAMHNASGDMANRVSDFVLIDPWAITCAGGMADATVSLNCGAGWYLTSIPLVAADPVAENVYNELPVFAAYQWNPGILAYDSLTGQNIAWSDGYWLWLMGNETVTVEGGEITTDQTITLGAAGWQQFSVPSVDIPVQPGMLGASYPVPAGAPDMMFSGDGGATWLTYVDAYIAGMIVEGIYQWDPCEGTEGAYVMMSQQNAVLDPWFGYWIETLADNVQIQIPVSYWVTNPWTQPTRLLPRPKSVTGRFGQSVPPAPPVLPLNLRIAQDVETGIVVMNTPNPIKDVNTTVFKAMATQPIDEIKVDIYDQTGSLVFSEELTGNEIVWHTDNEFGEYLANGVYIYRVSVKINGQWVETGARTLAIYR